MNLKNKAFSNDNLSFWGHLDVLRNYLFKIIISIFLCSIVAFCFKDILFSIVLAPKNSDFITYQIINNLAAKISPSTVIFAPFSAVLINTELAQQFIVHMKVAFYAGSFCVSPYIIYMLFKFIAPALYSNEKKYSLRAIIAGYFMFIFGVLICYFLIFPFAFRFLENYQVNEMVKNFISLDSYINTLIILCLLMGCLFELPVLCWLLANIGILQAQIMQHYRKHAIVIILIVATVITPTADIFTLLIVAIPIYLLYEVSIFIVKRTSRRKKTINF